MDAYLFESITQVKEMAWFWRIDYNEERTHESLGNLPPAVYRAKLENSSCLINGGVDNWAVMHIQKLYRVETQITDKTPEEKYALRQIHALPLLTEFKTWLDKTAQQTNPKSTLDEAVAYTLRQWEKLTTYTQHGQLCIDNNRAERAVKPCSGLMEPDTLIETIIVNH